MLKWFSHHTGLRTGLLLAALLTVVYAPFINGRFIRTSGDDKIYTNQVVDMAQAGNWFVQRLGDRPEYLKGPFHYVMVRLGMLAFGDEGASGWALLYMHLILILLGSWALASLMGRHLPDWQKRGGPFWLAFSFATCLGVFAYMFVSQMELELAALFAIGIWLLDRIPPGGVGLGFWLVTATIGWVKSPLQSVFLGISALLFWFWNGELWARLRVRGTWVGGIIGILVCIAGFLPAALTDWKNFFHYYIEWEMLARGSNGQAWSVPLLSVFGFYLIPWLATFLVAYLWLGLAAPFWRQDPPRARLIRLGFAVLLPSVMYFLFHRFRGEPNNLPVIAGLFVLLGAAYSSPNVFWRKAFAISMLFNLPWVLLLVAAISWVGIHFWPLPAWCPMWFFPTVLLGGLISAVGIFRYGFLGEGMRLDKLAISMVGFFLALGSVGWVIGEREMWDLRAEIGRNRIELAYYDPGFDAFSERGLLAFWIHQPVQAASSPEQAVRALADGKWLLVASDEQVAELESRVVREFPTLSIKRIPWRRWLTQGRRPDGTPAWKAAWESRDLTLLERQFWILQPSHQ